MEYMDYKEILKIVAKAAKQLETVEIYYPKTENTKAGWREIEPYSLTTDIPPDGEHLIYLKDRLSPGHILNAYTIGRRKDHCDSFIIGKIKKARFTGNKFTSRNNWKVEL